MSIAGLRCLVLGGGGFIGRHLVRALVAQGAVVSVYGRRSAEEAPHARGLPWHEADFADAGALDRALAGQQIVYHLLGGGLPAQWNDDPVGDVLGSLIPSLRLFALCRRHGIGRLVFVSSGGTVYGPTAAAPVAETAPTAPITAYGVNKLAAEHYLGLARHLHGFQPIVLRVANAYGPYQRPGGAQGLVATVMARALSGEPIEIWGDGSVVRDYVHVEDVVAALIAAAGFAGDEWIFNIGSGEGRSVREVVTDICRLSGTSTEAIRFQPGRPVDVPYNVLDRGLAARRLGWTPAIAWEDGLAATMDWMRAQLRR